MAIGIGFSIIILFMIGYDLYEKIVHYRNLRKYYPEHIRDRNKNLEVGQIWKASWGTTFTITFISGDTLKYDYYSPPDRERGDNGLALSCTKTVEDFRKEINSYYLHIAGLRTKQTSFQRPVMYGPVEPPTKGK